jgi:hypothetical protein
MTDREKLLLGGLVVVASMAVMKKVKPVQDAIVQKFAEAIAWAEGFYSIGSRPQRNHNPGDLTRDLTGTGVAKDGMYVVYATDADGWEALYKQVRMMFNNTSSIYNDAMNILEVARKYTTTDQEVWAANVAQRLGVPVGTPLSQITV